MVGPTGFAETSVRNYYNTLCNTSEEHSSQDRRYTYKIKTKRVRVTIVAVKNTITYSECVSVALFIQHVMRISLIISTSVACPALAFWKK
jgi:hypothetical protein